MSNALALPGEIPVLPADMQSRGGSVELIADELLWVISDAISQNPRGLQRAIGPSELGHPCARRLGYKTADTDTINTRAHDVAWKPAVGTAIHAMLETFFDTFNSVYVDSTQRGEERYLVEHRVTVGHVHGQAVSGSADLYDRVTATVVDWKTCGPSMLKKYRANGPGSQYRDQAHLYGRGFALLGHPVDNVMIVFLPRNGEFSDTYVWSEPYDETVALAALARVEVIAGLMTLGGSDALALLPTYDAWCFRCPYFNATAGTDLSRGCPGDTSLTAQPTPTLTLTA